MANDKYNTQEVFIESAQYKVIVISIPEDEIEDNLIYLAKEHGEIYQSLFYDFLMSKCISNIEDFIVYINNKKFDIFKINEIRKELIEAIIKFNTKLNPDDLVINHNNVIKLKKPGQKNVTPLTKNKAWKEDIYKKEEDKERIAKNNKEIIDKENIKNIKDIPFKPVQIFWPRIQGYIVIKQYDQKYKDIILHNKGINTRIGFEQFIVGVCVEDVDGVYTRLEASAQHVVPPILINELYTECVNINPFLDFKMYKEDIDDEYLDEIDANAFFTDFYNKKIMEKDSNNIQQGQRKRTRLFRHIKKEKLMGLATEIKACVVGQDDAVDDVVQAIQRASVGLKDPYQPIGAFIFAGYSGIGKTYMAKILAEKLTGDKRNMITIDCSEYSADHEYAKLIGCFIPGSKVLMGDGSSKNIEKINVGDEVITHTGNKRKVNFVHKYDQDGDMIEFTTVNSNIPVTTTKTHEIYAIKSARCQYSNKKHLICKPTCSKKECTNKLYENYKPTWLPASELENGDIVMYPRYKPTSKYPNKIDLVDYIRNKTHYKYNNEFVWAQKHVKVPRYINVNKNFMRLAGYYVSEGGVSGNGKAFNFTFNSKETNYIIEVIKLLRKLFGEDIRIKIEDRVKKGNTYRISVSSKIVCNFMSKLFGKNTYVKRVPEWFKDLPDEYIKNFLETAVFGDGCTAITRRMDYSTVSSDLFYQMELLFRRLGYITYKQLEPCSKIDNVLSDRYRLYIGGNQIEKLNKEFNFNIDLSGLTQTNIQRKAWIDDDYLYLQIKEIGTVQYTGKVYDLEVEKDASYVIETSVHNSPAGYIGHDQGGQLTNAVKKNPFCIILFDEIEKASDKVHQLLLQIMEEGRLTDGRGQPVSFRDTVVIMTSNLGVKELENVEKTIGFGQVATLTKNKREKAIKDGLKKKFKPEFINRITSIVQFNELTKKHYMRIIKLELEKLKDNLRANNTNYSEIELVFDKSLYNYIYKDGVNGKMGARPLKRAIENKISTPLAVKLLTSTINEFSIVYVSIKNNKLDILIEQARDVDAPPFYLQLGAGKNE